MRLVSPLIPLALTVAMAAGCTSSPGTFNEVVGESDHFANGDLSIAAGTTVMFRMAQGSHTVDFAENQALVDGVSAPHSGNLAPGSTFEVMFTKAGTYPYFCQYHSSLQGGQRTGMVGTIVVAAG